MQIGNDLGCPTRRHLDCLTAIVGVANGGQCRARGGEDLLGWDIRRENRGLHAGIDNEHLDL